MSKLSALLAKPLSKGSRSLTPLRQREKSVENSYQSDHSISHLAPSKNMITDNTSRASHSQSTTPKKRLKFKLDIPRVVKGVNDSKGLNSSLSTGFTSFVRSSSTSRPATKQNSVETRTNTNQSLSERKEQFNSTVRDIVRRKNISTESVAFRNKPGIYMVFRKDAAPENITEGTLKNLLRMLDEITKLETLIRRDPNKCKEDIYEAFQQLYMISHSVRLHTLIMKILELYSKVATTFGDFSKSIYLLKQYKSMCIFFNTEPQKMKCYRWLAQVCQQNQEYDRAIMYLKKQLTLSWKLEDTNYELMAYDNIGMQYYYKGDTTHARYFHNRMKKGLLESKTSNHRRIAINAIENSIVKKQLSAVANFKDDDNLKLYFSSGEEDMDIPFNIKTAGIEEFGEGEEAEEKLKQRQEKEQSDGKKAMIAVHRIMRSRQGSLDHVRDILNSNLDRTKPITARKISGTGFYTNREPDTKDINKWIINMVSNNQVKLGSTKLNDPVRTNHLSVNRKLNNFHLIDRPGSTFKEGRVHSHNLSVKARGKLSSLLQKCRNELLKHTQYIKSITSDNFTDLDLLSKLDNTSRKREASPKSGTLQKNLEPPAQTQTLQQSINSLR